MSLRRYSKFLSLVLRHRPALVDIRLDPAGWAPVDDLLAGLREHDPGWDRARLERVVRDNDKQRFEISPDGTRIRARQGHSVDVDLGYEPVEPPERLYHGTVERSLEAIEREGLRPMGRHHVHLSPDVATARRVGGRRGRPVVLVVDARGLHEVGARFYRTGNDVWLVDRVPAGFLSRA